jgi:hypothetical protein
LYPDSISRFWLFVKFKVVDVGTGTSFFKRWWLCGKGAGLSGFPSAADDGEPERGLGGLVRRALVPGLVGREEAVDVYFAFGAEVEFAIDYGGHGEAQGCAGTVALGVLLGGVEEAVHVGGVDDGWAAWGFVPVF